MPSASSRRRRSSSSGDRDEVAQLLQDGAVFHEPSATLAAAADRLSSLRLVSVERSSYVVCADPAERDFRFVRDRVCKGRVVLRRGADEAGNDYACPACHRVVYPVRSGKRVRSLLRVAVQVEGVLSYVRDELATLGADVRDVAAGVFRVDVGELGVVVCVVEYCEAEKYVSQQWASIAPTCYVTVDPAHAADGFLATWTTKAALADVVSGTVDLCALVRRLADEGTPVGVVPASPRVYSRPVAPVVIGEAAAVAPGRRFIVEAAADSVRVEGVDVIARQADVRFEVFWVLWKQFLADLHAERAAEDFAFLPLADIVAKLQSEFRRSSDDDESVRKVLNNLQASIETAVKTRVGAPIGREDVIEMRRSAGKGGGKFGYRINPRTVCARPFQGPPE